MPHGIIELTKNLSSNIDLTDLMRDIARAINIDNIFIEDDIKIRIHEIKHSFMGINLQDYSYVTAEIILLDNKQDTQVSNILNSVQEILIQYFKTSVSKQSITSRITRVDPKDYQRLANY